MRAMAQCIDNKAEAEQLQGAPNPDMDPTVELHRTKEDAIKEFVQKHCTIALDWYVPDFCNTKVGDLIKERLHLKPQKAYTRRILQNTKFRVRSQDRTGIHISGSTREHRY